MTINLTNHSDGWLSTVKDQNLHKGKSTRKKCKKVIDENCNRFPLRTIQFNELSQSNRNTKLHQTRVSSYYKKCEKHSKVSRNKKRNKSKVTSIIPVDENSTYGSIRDSRDESTCKPKYVDDSKVLLHESICKEEGEFFPLNRNKLSPCMISRYEGKISSQFDVSGATVNTNELSQNISQNICRCPSYYEGNFIDKLENEQLNKPSNIRKQLSYSDENHVASSTCFRNKQSLTCGTQEHELYKENDYHTLYGENDYSSTLSTLYLKPPSPIKFSQDTEFDAGNDVVKILQKDAVEIYTESPLHSEYLSSFLVNADTEVDNSNVILAAPSPLAFTEESSLGTNLKDESKVAIINDRITDVSSSEDTCHVDNSYSYCSLPSPIRFTEI